jgi:AcrR family transcriptional regulator
LDRETDEAMKGPATAPRRSPPTGDATRQRIIEAAFETLAASGIAGTSARAIARRGGFNQALIFYHFGSVEGLLLAAALQNSELRAALYAERFSEVSTLEDLVSVAREVHAQEQAAGSAIVLAQLLAGTSSSPELARGVAAGMQPWISLVQDTLGRVLRPLGLAGVVPTRDVAFAIVSMFVGMELLSGLETDADVDSAEAFLDTAAMLAAPFASLGRMLAPRPLAAG